MSEQISSKLISYAVFLVTLGVIGVSILSVMFPALIISNTYEFSNDLDPFESNSWLPSIIISISSATPPFISSIITLGYDESHILNANFPFYNNKERIVTDNDLIHMEK